MLNHRRKPAPSTPRRCAKPDCRNKRPCPDHPSGWDGYRKKIDDGLIERLPSDWTSRVRAVKERDNGICQSCNRPTVPGVVDHVTPRFLGGSSDTSNLQLLCVPCHHKKTVQERKLGASRSKRKRV